MRILCFSDTHEKVEVQEKIMDELEYDLCICAGDIEKYREAPKPFFFVPGNHDIDMHSEILENIRAGYIELENWIYLTPGKVHLDPFPIAGLGGNFAPTDYDKNRKELKNQRHFTKREVQISKDLKPRPTVFVSHEAPYSVGDYVKGNHYGVKPVFGILDALRPKFMISGHIHAQQISRWRESLVINPGYGLKEEYIIIDTEKNQIEIWKGFETVEIRNYEM